MNRSISAGDAQQELLKLAVTQRSETVTLEGAITRVAAVPITAKIPIPPFDRSPYDGYAFRGADTENATAESPTVLRITEEIPAGAAPTLKITPGYAAKILTGAPIPAGADSTIKYELTEYNEKEVRIFNRIPPNTDVVYAGADVKAGTVLASKGTALTAPVIASIAAQGLDHLDVFIKPVITVINTGSELCRLGEPLRPYSIYNSSVYALSSYLINAGTIPINGGVVSDDPDKIAAAVSDALDKSDMVITTGGASVGDYDFAVTSAQRLGAQLLFKKIDMKPGGAMMAAVKNGKVILGLSGNPAAAVIALLHIAMPYIKKLCGRSDYYFPEVSVILREPFTKSSPKTRLLRGRLVIENTHAFFIESGGQGSEMLSSLIDCDLLAEIPAGSPPLAAGTVIRAYRVDRS